MTLRQLVISRSRYFGVTPAQIGVALAEIGFTETALREMDILNAGCILDRAARLARTKTT